MGLDWLIFHALDTLRLQGKDLFMDLDEGSLKLIDPENGAVLNSQPIHTIRVWGVGRDNGR
jgi:amyloid beta A4 precursor protein-binding family B member 2